MNAPFGGSHRLARFGLLALIAAAGCTMPDRTPKDWAAVVVDLEPVDATDRTTHPPTMERKWIGFGLVPPEGDAKAAITGPATVQVRLRTGPTDAKDPQARASETFEIKNVDIGRPRAPTGEAMGPVVVTLDSPAASLTLTGGPIEWPYGREKVVGGVARVTFNREFLSAARDIEPKSSTITLLRAALLGVSSAELRMYDRLELQPNLAQVIDLVQAGVAPSAIEAYYAAGYGLTVADLLRLQAGGVSVEDAVAFRKDGFEFTADELLRVKGGDVTPAYARGMKEAGFAQDVDMLLRLRSAGVSTDYANRMRGLKVATDESSLTKLHTASISPTTVETFQRARYTPNADQLIEFKTAGVKADDALYLRDAGYDFSHADLINLAKWQVPVGFTLGLMSKEFEPLSADQIVDMRLRRVTPEMVRALRQPRQATGVAARDERRRLPDEADGVDAIPGVDPGPITLPDLPPPEPELEPAGG